ncbi:hypothetical protein HQ571_05345 [Candidatus Kuenenbacteria bacterium]|nr:hypothetical protein [Candidatus Kuenenbacteria bacterium]
MVNTQGYMLVKDKDGQLKYYKDGQFFDIKEIEKEQNVEKQVGETQKKVLSPVFTFESKKKAVAEKVSAKSGNQVKPVETVKAVEPVKPDKPVKPVNHVKQLKPTARPEASQPIVFVPREEIELEKIDHDPELNQRRGQDKKLVEEKVNHVINKLKIEFSDQKIKDRFFNILVTYFRGIRKPKEVKYILTVPRVSGGLELPSEKAELIVAFLEQEAQLMEKERRDGGNTSVKKVIDIKHRLEPPPPAVINNKQTPTAKLAAVAARSKPIKREVEKVPFQKVVRPTLNLVPEGKAKPGLENIKHHRKLIGPVEELEFMNLKDLRTLGKDEKEIMEEIMEKIQVLAGQSLGKKLEGINAWKKSSVFKLYIAMTLEAIREKKPITATIEKRQRENKDSLSLSEYEMFSKLNEQLNN